LTIKKMIYCIILFSNSLIITSNHPVSFSFLKASRRTCEIRRSSICWFCGVLFTSPTFIVS